MTATVQNLAVSSWIDRKPFKWPEIGRELGNACLLVIIHEMMSTLWKQFIGAILDNFLGTRFTKNAILSNWKMKSGFFCETCRNLFRQHCLLSHNEHMCQFWDHLDKLCHECGQNIAPSSWKLWMFVRYSKFPRTLFQ